MDVEQARKMGIPRGRIQEFTDYYHSKVGDEMDELFSTAVSDFLDIIDAETETTCVICATVIVFDEDDWYDCDKCCNTCCTDCHVYRPDISGKKTMEDEDDCDWNYCEVCITCEREFDEADDGEKEKIIQAMKAEQEEY